MTIISIENGDVFLGNEDQLKEDLGLTLEDLQAWCNSHNYKFDVLTT